MMTPDEVRHHLTGPVTSIFMPFTRDGAIDERSLRGMIDRDIQNGSRSIILTAGDSMFNILTDDEADRVTRITVEQTAGRAMVVAADKSWWLGREIEWARRVREIGADMLMARPPGGIVEPEAFVEYYRGVARHIPVMVVTNVFDRDEMDFNRRTIEMVRDRVDGVMAMKDDLIGDFITQVAPLVHGEWAVMSGGQMKNHLFTLPYGCDGFMDVFRMLNPDISDRYWAAIQAEDLD
ncbi:MAG: dihydrodipicolinate synthase family protein, partial [Armatimonadota bacterium]